MYRTLLCYNYGFPHFLIFYAFINQLSAKNKTPPPHFLPYFYGNL